MAFCKFFGECPVCKFQHLPYDDTLRLKAEEVERLFGLKPRIVPSPKDRAYRSRVIFHLRRPHPTNLIIGYTLERGFVFGVDSCPLLDPALEELIRPLNGILASAPLSVWDVEKGKGKLVSLTLVGDGNGVVLSLNLRKPLFVKRLTFELMDKLPSVVGVWWSVGTFGEYITGGRGEMFRTLRRGRYVFKVSPYGDYPDNLHILSELWRYLEGLLEGRVVAFMTGLHVPPFKMSTYVDLRGMPVREVRETAEAVGVSPDVRQMEPGAFLLVNPEPYDFAVIHTDRVKDRRVMDVARRTVLIGESPRRLRDFLTDGKPREMLLFDLYPYTDKSLLVALL
ncbi:MAG: hypothetical protein GXO29_03415 [Thermotogae bacterium]|nr:hypothetical protein [Thermotogota bacterium]